MNSGTSGTEQTAEPDRENYAVFRKCLCRPENNVAGRLAQDVRFLKHYEKSKSYI